MNRSHASIVSLAAQAERVHVRATCLWRSQRVLRNGAGCFYWAASSADLVMRCLYEVLNVDVDVEEAALRKSYRRLALQWHPGALRTRVWQHINLLCVLYEF